MGTPLMIQPADDRTILELKAKMGAKSKVDVVRAGLSLLASAVERKQRIERWKRVAKKAAKVSQEVNREFQEYSHLRKI